MNESNKDSWIMMNAVFLPAVLQLLLCFWRLPHCFCPVLYPVIPWRHRLVVVGVPEVAWHEQSNQSCPMIIFNNLHHWWLVAVTLIHGYQYIPWCLPSLSLGKPLLHSVQHYLPEVKHRTWKWRVPRNAFFLGSILRFNVRNIFPTCQLSAFWHEALVSNMSTVEACASVEARGPTCRWSPW